jgi:regulator of protease activity HflC (stomatin/prohibitin superfamily)
VPDESSTLPPASLAGPRTMFGSGLSAVLVAFLVCLALFVSLWPHIFVPIHSGEAGVLWRRFGGGTDTERTYGEGTLITWPWNKVYVYDTTLKHIRVEAPVYTADGMLMHVTVSGRCRPDPQRLPQLHSEIGPDYLSKLIEPELITSVRTVIGKYDSKQVYTQGEQGLAAEIRKMFRNRLDDHDIIYDDVLLVKLLMPDLVQDAVQQKLAVEQDALSYEFKLERERDEKERRIIEAEGIETFSRISGVSMLHWRALETTKELALSPNAKIVVLGNDAKSLPVLLNAEFNEAAPAEPQSLDAESGSLVTPLVESPR